MRQGETNWLAVGYGLGLSVLAAYQLFKLPPVLPVLLDVHGYDRVLAGGFMSVYAMAGLILSLLVGRTLERRDPGLPVLAGLALLGAGNLLPLALSPSGPTMLVARTIEGLGFAVLAVAGPLMANRAAAQRHLPMIVAATATWIPIGQIIAALMAAMVLSRFGWSFLWVFGLAGTVVLALLLPLAGASRAAGLRTSSGEAARPGSPGKLPGAVRHGLWLGGGIFMLWSGQFFAFMTWLPQFLTEAIGLDLSAALAGYLLPVGVLLAFNLMTGLMLRAGLALGPLLALALSLQAVVWWLHPWVGEGAAGVVLLVVYGVGAGITPTCLFALPSMLAGPEGSSRAFGVLMTGRNVGVLVGPILLAELFKSAGSWSVSGPVFGGLTVLAAGLAAVLALGYSGAVARPDRDQGTKR